MTNDVRLCSTTGGVLHVALNGPDVWPNQVCFWLHGDSELNLGNLERQEFPGRLTAWLDSSSSFDATYEIDGIPVGCIATFSPLRYVIYGTATSSPRALFIVDANTSPDLAVARLYLDDEAVAQWSVLLSSF